MLPSLAQRCQRASQHTKSENIQPRRAITSATHTPSHISDDEVPIQTHFAWGNWHPFSLTKISFFFSNGKSPTEGEICLCFFGVGFILGFWGWETPPVSWGSGTTVLKYLFWSPGLHWLSHSLSSCTFIFYHLVRGLRTYARQGRYAYTSPYTEGTQDGRVEKRTSDAGVERRRARRIYMYIYM